MAKIRHPKKDPTGSLRIRNAWIAQFNIRYKKLKGDVNRFFDVVSKSENRLTNAAEDFVFQTDAEKLQGFMLFLQQRIDTLLLLPGNADGSWQNQYITDGYNRGLISAQQEIAAAIGQTSLFPQIPDLIGTATPSLSSIIGVSAFTTVPLHLDAIRLLYTRDYAQLEGITQAMSQQISQILADGIEQGLGSEELARRINDRINKIGLTRSRLLARTETVRAYNVGNVNEGLVEAENLNIDVKWLWQTSQDERVRSSHRHRHGKLYTEKEVRALIGEPNCRCRISVFPVDLDDPERMKERADQREAGLKLAA